MRTILLEVLAIGFGLFSVIMVISYYLAVKRLNSVSYGFAQLYKDYVAMQDILNAQTASKPALTEDDLHRENFIKFLSESRDWAFTYIEDVQNVIKKFIDEVQPQLDYYNQYGTVVEGMVPPHDFALKKISKEIDDLKKLLPEESDDRR